MLNLFQTTHKTFENKEINKKPNKIKKIKYLN